ncbi:unnamed protein product [Timema podura]|uniref:Peptidase M1 leukotriene A4 hydrolase/aminopeptidase C-terminal domain-containing protein n=1 Tax=Timema podura TaxID=61482 RepID=A0ABN7NUA7_TIMPD|nr:unnamed protein product [Timema podura]
MNEFIWCLGPRDRWPEGIWRREVFDPFLKDYLDHFKHRSIMTNDFIKYLNEYFPDNKDLKLFDWELWLNTPGMPPVIPTYDTTLADDCIKLSKKWVSWDGQGDCPFQTSDLSSFSAQQVKEFVALLLHEAPLSQHKLKTMDKEYDLSSKTNAEIRFRLVLLGHGTVDWYQDVVTSPSDGAVVELRSAAWRVGG